MYCCGKTPRYTEGWKNESQNSTYIMISSVCGNRYELDYTQKMSTSVHRVSAGGGYL